MIAESLRAATRYSLGAGGFRPEMQWPWNGPSRSCDCSGFFAWLLGEPRQHDILEWIETSRIWYDALHDRKLFEQVINPLPGDAWVWPDKGKIGHRTQGHVSLIWSASEILHCSRSNERTKGTAIAVSSRSIYKELAASAGAIFVRPIIWRLDAEAEEQRKRDRAGETTP